MISNPTMTNPPKQRDVRFFEKRGSLKLTSGWGLSRPIPNGFSLIEVTIALGLVAYALLALLGLFAVGLSSSRESTTVTALSQIALHVSSSYSGTISGQSLDYSYEGLAITGSNSSLQKHFVVTLSTVPNTISNTSTNLHLLKISITSPQNPAVTNVIQTSAFVP